MEQKAMLDVLVQVKRMGKLLNEVQDLSQQLAEAVDRDDRVSVEMLVAMRREPIDKLVDTEEVLDDLIDALPAGEGERLKAVLAGASAEQDSEKILADLVGANRRRLEQVRALDKVVNRKLTREKSVYQ